MLLLPHLKAWCQCSASLGPLTIKRGAILSPHCLLWALEVKRQKCEIMNECLAVYWRFPSSQLKWEYAPDANQATIFKENRWLALFVGVDTFNFGFSWHLWAHRGGAMDMWDLHMIFSLWPNQTSWPLSAPKQMIIYTWDHRGDGWSPRGARHLTASGGLQMQPSTLSRGLLWTCISPYTCSPRSSQSCVSLSLQVPP